MTLAPGLGVSPSRAARRSSRLFPVAVGALALAACGGASRARPPQTGKPQLSAARVGMRVQKVLVADKEMIAMVGRDGCHATVRRGRERDVLAGEGEELRVRCPRKDRLASWFEGLERTLATMDVADVPEDDDDDTVPAAEIVVGKGHVLKVLEASDVGKLVSVVRAFGAELEQQEIPRPGPASASGWQMLRVTGAARVVVGGEPTRGVLDARLSTSGQYFCDFVGATGDGQVRATKSGWITGSLAARALDEVLTPFQVQPQGEAQPSATFVAATTNGAEKRANPASTAAVFERFAPLQDALGDACLPELEPPATSRGL